MLLCFFSMDEFIHSSLAAVELQIDPSSVKSLFDTLGVEDAADSTLLTDKDLCGVMKTIQARMLIKHWKSKR